jgi:hypothetical protein
MRFVEITKEQANRIETKKIGFTSGKRNKDTGVRPSIMFCSSLEFVSAFGYEVDRKFIEI